MLPILFPLIPGLGFDPIWFGIIMIVWLEIGFITPPVGLNLFVIQGLTPGATARDMMPGTTPYGRAPVPRARPRAVAAETHDGPLITLATCAAWPELSVSDQCLADALRARQQRVTAAPWNGSFEPFANAAAVVIRSTWDYHEAPDAYLAWCSQGTWC